MTARRHPFATEPAGLKRQDAAWHCGVSPGHFDRMVKRGDLPPPRRLGGVNVWLRQELEAALFALEPKDAGTGRNSCDEAFGLI